MNKSNIIIKIDSIKTELMQEYPNKSRITILLNDIKQEVSE